MDGLEERGGWEADSRPEGLVGGGHGGSILAHGPEAEGEGQ